MASPALTYPDWKAPAEDGKLLIWPEPAELCRQTLSNQTFLSAADVRVQNVPLSELRRQTRQWLGHDDAQLLIADGHQTELYHPGVWAKSVLANEAAARLNGHALHLAVDTDAPKHLTLRWPGGTEPITDDPQLNKAHWSGLLDAPTPRQLSDLEAAIARTSFEHPPMVAEFLASLRRLSLEQVKLSAALTNAMHELDWQLGLRHHALLASPVWESRGFLVFVHHIIARAGEFAAAYNGALAEYRKRNKVRTATRPMPDLPAFEESVELPLWLDELATGGRTRPTAFTQEGGYVIAIPNGDEFHFDPAADGFDAADRLAAWLRKNQLRFSPRALVLTMFVRLCVADQFIHGIGGGRYDQVTDTIIANYFGIEPPRFCVTTATMYLPEAAGRLRICVPCIEREGHALRHAALGQAKQPYLKRIAEAPRRSQKRYEAFAQMHRELAGAVATHPKIRAWEQRLEEAQKRESAEAVLFDRELFYALQPAERLESMIAQYHAYFS